MCGIVGFWTNKELPIEPELAYEAIYSAFRKQQSRGTDSFGLFAYNENEDKGYIKKVSSVLSIRKLFVKDGNLFLFHHRLSSIGKKTLKNQHPFLINFKGKKLVVAHNGTWRDFEKFRFNYPVKGETDSETIGYLIADDVSNLKLISNSSLVWFDKNTGTLNFWRDYLKPMWLGYHRVSDTFLFASTFAAVKELSKILFGQGVFGIFDEVLVVDTKEYELYSFFRKNSNLGVKRYIYQSYECNTLEIFTA